MNMHTYSIVYEPYERFESSAPKTKTFKAPSKKHAIIKADPNCGWGCGKWPEEEEEVQKLLSISEEDLLNNLEMSNGDGTDYLFLLKDETTGEIIFEDEDFDEDSEEEEWED